MFFFGNLSLFFPDGFIFGSFLFIKVSLYYDSLRAGVHFTQYMEKNKILSESTPSTVKENQKTNKSEQNCGKEQHYIMSQRQFMEI